MKIKKQNSNEPQNSALNISDVKRCILERIKTHETTIKDTLKFIKTDLNEDTLKRMTPLIESEEIRISELKAVLKYCF